MRLVACSEDRVLPLRLQYTFFNIASLKNGSTAAIRSDAHNQNIPGEGAAPPQAAAPAEVPQADLEPSPSEDQSSSSFEEANVESERGAAAEAVEDPVPVPQFRIDHQEEESSLYQRIRQLEASCGYLIPPQMEEGGYLRSVQTYLNEGAELGKNHYEAAL